jgi:hypothetical protein
VFGLTRPKLPSTEEKQRWIDGSFLRLASLVGAQRLLEATVALPKPKPDADGFIWHPRPGYPDQEISEPDAQGRVAYKIHMTTTASQLPSRETDAQRAAKLIYGSVIKKHGNP